MLIFSSNVLMYNLFLIWMNRAKLYWNLIEDPRFCIEFNYMKKEMGLMVPVPVTSSSTSKK